VGESRPRISPEPSCRSTGVRAPERHATRLTLLRQLEIPAAPLNTPGALFDDPHLAAVGMFETVDTPHGPVRFPGVPTWFSRTPGRVAGPAPELGAHTEEMLAEIGASRHASTRHAVSEGAFVSAREGKEL